MSQNFDDRLRPASGVNGGLTSLKKFVLSLAAVVLIAGIAAWFWTRRDFDEKAKWKPGDPIGASQIRIGVIYITNPETETSGYTHEHSIGIKEMKDALQLSDEQIMTRFNVPDTEPDAIDHALRELIASGANVIFATSFGYMDSCERLASENPDVIFAHLSGYKRNSTNFTNYFGRIYLMRYLSGIAAGMKTRTNKIGYVAAWGKKNSEVTGGLDAFAMGVESVNPNARVYVKAINNWFDPAGEALAARTLIGAGCDVIGQHCDTAMPQIEAERAGVWGIGYNSDMSHDAPKAVITSVIWRWGIYYIAFVQSVIDGAFTTDPYFGGINEGLVGLAPLNETTAEPGTKEAIELALDRMKNGELEVFAGEMETNDVRRIGTDGKALQDDEIKVGIDWYYRNIVEL
jgi:basic membrane protein A